MILKPNNYYNIIRMSDWNYAHCRRFEIPHHIDFNNSFITHNSQTYIIQTPTKSIVEIISKIICRKAL